ncbi:MAG: aldehyde dehydrogenase family protein [Phycisphaerae bacterium]
MSVTMLPEVKKFLSNQPLKFFVGGKHVTAAAGGAFETRDPGTGEVLATVAAADAQDVDATIGAAAHDFAHSPWATMPANDRAVILHRLADLIDKHTPALAQLESLDVGKPLAQAVGFDIPFTAKAFRYFADLSVHARRREPLALQGIEAHTLRKPYGVCGFVLPWNFPFLLLGWNLAPALAAGNAVVLKPAEDTPLTSLYFAELCQQVGIPAGIVNIITGFGHTTGAALSKHPGLARIAFTGSPEVGRLVAEAAGRNLIPCKLELGGKGAAVIFDDVDIAATAKQLAAAVTLNSGQVCCTATRWLVHEKIFDQFAAQAKHEMQSLKLGHALDTHTQMGPVVSAKQKQRVLGYLDKGRSQGATAVLEGGSEPSLPGFFVKPALLQGPPENICAKEEIFGPVAYLMRFKDEAQALQLVNASRYGLANSVWSADLARAQRVAEALVAGNSWINAHNVFAYGLPYGGVNLSGMGGGVNSPETFYDYLRPQTIARPLA